MSELNQNIELSVEAKKLIHLLNNILSNDNNGKISLYDSIDEKAYIELVAENSDKFLKEFRVNIKDKLVKKFDMAVAMAKEKLNPDCEKYDDIIKLQSRYNRVNSIFIEGRLDYQTADLEFNKIENTFIILINDMILDDFKDDVK